MSEKIHACPECGAENFAGTCWLCVRETQRSAVFRAAFRAAPEDKRVELAVLYLCGDRASK
jgi:hypothetical protein